MVKYLRDKTTGTYAGSIGDGKTKIPTPSPVRLNSFLKESVDLKTELLSQKVGVVKCTHPSHQFNGCDSLDCPEGLSIPKIIRKIKNSPELLEELKLDGINKPDYRHITNYVSSTRNWHTWLIRDINTDTSETQTLLILPPDRPNVVEAVDKINKTIIPSFETPKEIELFVSELYGKDNVNLTLLNKNTGTFYGGRNPQRYYSLSDLYISADLRGRGVGSHVMEMIAKHADERNIIFSLNPTESGDGSIFRNQRNENKYQTKRREHYKRLTAFYKRYNFQENPAYTFQGKTLASEITPNKVNTQFIEKLNDEAAHALEHAILARFPNGKISKNIYKTKQ